MKNNIFNKDNVITMEGTTRPMQTFNLSSFIIMIVLLIVFITIYMFIDSGDISTDSISNIFKNTSNDSDDNEELFEIDEKQKWIISIISYLHELNVTKHFLYKDIYNHTIKDFKNMHPKNSFMELELEINQYFRLVETSKTGYICNHVRLVMFNGYDKMSVKDFAEIYAIIVMLSNIK